MRSQGTVARLRMTRQCSGAGRAPAGCSATGAPQNRARTASTGTERSVTRIERATFRFQNAARSCVVRAIMGVFASRRARPGKQGLINAARRVTSATTQNLEKLQVSHCASCWPRPSFAWPRNLAEGAGAEGASAAWVNGLFLGAIAGHPDSAAAGSVIRLKRAMRMLDLSC